MKIPAIDDPSTTDIIIVHDGTYVENINFPGKTITVRSKNGLKTTTIDGSNPYDTTFGYFASALLVFTVKYFNLDYYEDSSKFS